MNRNLLINIKAIVLHYNYITYYDNHWNSELLTQ